jgi:drug/metabolite transporter (DMT)-like permease
MLGAVASFASMQTSGRELSGGYGPVDTMLYRGLVGVILMLPIALAFGGIRNVTTGRPFGHLLRNAVHFLGQFAWFYGIAHLALAEVTALSSMMPIFGVVLAIVFIGERLTLPRLMAILCGFAGVLIVVRPGVVPLEVATGVTILGALCYAISIVMVKSLTATEPPLRIVFYMMAMQCGFALALAGGRITIPTLAEIPWIIVVGISGLTAHYCMARSVAIADASVIMPISFLSLPTMATIGYAFYGEGLDPFTLGGGGLILGATYLNIVWSRRRAVVVTRAS